MIAISKRTREQAALICAVAASNPHLAESYNLTCLHLRRVGIPMSDAAYDLAFAAWEYVTDALGRDFNTPNEGWVDAEAESLLRTGWIP